MNEDLQAKICEILNESTNSGRVQKFLACLSQNGVKDVDDLSYMDKDLLKELNVLSEEEIENVLKKKFQKLDEVLQDIFKGGKQENIEKILHCLKMNGVTATEDLKYFDWESLGSMGLTKMEAEKIMYFLKKNFREFYEEHKNKHDKQKKLMMEKELADKKAEAEYEIIVARAETRHKIITRHYDDETSKRSVEASSESSPRPKYTKIFILTFCAGTSYLLSRYLRNWVNPWISAPSIFLTIHFFSVRLFSV